jgi:hypothetical protein
LIEILIEDVEKLCGYKPEVFKIKEFIQSHREHLFILSNSNAIYVELRLKILRGFDNYRELNHLEDNT